MIRFIHVKGKSTEVNHEPIREETGAPSLAMRRAILKTTKEWLRSLVAAIAQLVAELHLRD